MEIQFSKYQGTGNDFVMLDNLSGAYDGLSLAQIQQLCDRRFGIGADGLIKINQSSIGTFEMDYYNADGSKSFCGNGARCAVDFAATLGIDVENVNFAAIDGLHSAARNPYQVRLKMNDVLAIKKDSDAFVLHTGSPHYVLFNDDLSTENITRIGREIRYSSSYEKEGINVNLVQQVNENEIAIATYERGVEAETLSCGTGATACALVLDFLSELPLKQVKVKVKGGELTLEFERVSSGHYQNIYLSGPATFVFSGEIDV